MTDEWKYEDMLFLPHFVSQKHAHMSLHDRAAQFSPFAALKGYGEAIEEASSPVQTYFQSEERKERLDEVFRELNARQKERPLVQATCFDGSGSGRFFTVRGRFLRFEEGKIVLNAQSVPFEKLVDLMLEPSENL